MRIFVEQADALQRLRGKAGQQTVTVEHVHVHEGGQAIVGTVAREHRRGGRGMERKTAEPPHEKRRRGRLKNGNQSGDFSKAARCGAKTRRGTWCQCPAMKNGRCRLHGGLSTGPKTAEGIERIRRAVTKHGNYTKRAMTERAEYRELLRGLAGKCWRICHATGRLNDKSRATFYPLAIGLNPRYTQRTTWKTRT